MAETAQLAEAAYLNSIRRTSMRLKEELDGPPGAQSRLRKRSGEALRGRALRGRFTGWCDGCCHEELGGGLARAGLGGLGSAHSGPPASLLQSSRLPLIEEAAREASRTKNLLRARKPRPEGSSSTPAACTELPHGMLVSAPQQHFGG